MPASAPATRGPPRVGTTRTGGDATSISNLDSSDNLDAMGQRIEDEFRDCLPARADGSAGGLRGIDSNY